MLLFASRGIPCGFSSPGITEEGNVALEAFLLYYRNLRAFLCPSLQRLADDDVIAADFLDRGAAEDVADVAELGRDKERLDRLLAHISYSRAHYARDGQEDWDVPAMVQRMKHALAAFFRQLPDDRCVWFNVKVEH